MTVRGVLGVVVTVPGVRTLVDNGVHFRVSRHPATDAGHHRQQCAHIARPLQD